MAKQIKCDRDGCKEDAAVTFKHTLGLFKSLRVYVCDTHRLDYEHAAYLVLTDEPVPVETE